MSLRGQSLIVLGAGIGGLAVATALALRGAEVRVLEQAEALGEVGAGIQISQNGAIVLHALGISPQGAAVRGEGVELRDGRAGRLVLRLPPPRAGPTWYWHRADLLAHLERRARAAGVRVDLGARVVAVTPGEARTEVRLADGTCIHSPWVIGADGVRGVARTAVLGPSAARFSGQVAWRALVAAPHPNRAVVSMGPGRHVVSYPLRGGAVTNIVAVEERTDWTSESWRSQGDPSDLRARFAGFGGAVAGLLAQVDSAHLWALYLHPVAKNWARGGLALLGDAAHPTLPFMAQGACMALEDAWALAACLDDGRGLAGYQALRRARAERIVAAAAANAHRFHLRGPARQIAQTGLRLFGGLAAPRYDWLYGFDVTA